jgi:hypothetical protein
MFMDLSGGVRPSSDAACNDVLVRQEEWEQFTIAELLFSDGTGLIITDWQKALILTLGPKPTKVPDALSIPDSYQITAFKAISPPGVSGQL